MAFITAYNKRGEKQTIPEHWLSDPVLKRGFSVEPPHKQTAHEGGESSKKGRKATHEAPAAGDDKKE